ncbi:MAG TPA: hypothetical protein PKW80_01880 [Bacteroidales bacterium]|nr:hypothetical protein [Bacteroidales bacterium]
MKTIHIFVVITCAIVLFSACSDNKEEKNENKAGVTCFSSDMENTGWINQTTLTRETAHSGKFSSRVDSVQQYSFGFRDFFKNINDTLPEKVDVSFWILYPQKDIKSTMVISIDSVEKNIFWQGTDLKDSVQVPNQWKEIKTTIELPENIMQTDRIAIYIWGTDKKSFYIDDMKVTFGKK